MTDRKELYLNQTNRPDIQLRFSFERRVRGSTFQRPRHISRSSQGQRIGAIFQSTWNTLQLTWTWL